MALSIRRHSRCVIPCSFLRLAVYCHRHSGFYSYQYAKSWNIWGRYLLFLFSLKLRREKHNIRCCPCIACCAWTAQSVVINFIYCLFSQDTCHGGSFSPRQPAPTSYPTDHNCSKDRLTARLAVRICPILQYISDPSI